MFRFCRPRFPPTHVVTSGVSSTFRKNFDLEDDFFHAMKNHFGAYISQPLAIKERNAFVRGLYLGSNSYAKRGEVLAAIPLNKAAITVDSIHKMLTTKIKIRNDVTEEAVYKQVSHLSKGVISLVPQIAIAVNLALVIRELPDSLTSTSIAEYDEMQTVLKSGLASYTRMIDDESFVDEMVWHLYSTALDDNQKKAYQEMLAEFNNALHAVRDGLKLTLISAEHLRRIARITLARVDHISTPDWIRKSPRARNFSRLAHRIKCIFKGESALPELVGKQVAIVPLADMINHSNRPTVALQYGRCKELNGEYCATIVALRDLAPGVELARHYNVSLQRPSLLFRYGFLPFEVINVVEQDAFREHYLGSPLLTEVSWLTDKRKSLGAEELELEKLESLYKKARSGNH